MAISQAQADTSREFHDPLTRPCDSKAGPARWRRNGRTQRWKSPMRRLDFSIPVKFGLYSYMHIDSGTRNAESMHAIEDCPVEAYRPAKIEDQWKAVR